MDTDDRITEPEMLRSDIILSDGRYLIFYSFDQSADSDEKESHDSDKEK